METRWLLETGEPPRYWTPIRDTTNADNAVGFCRKDDAEQVRKWIASTEYKVVEHSFDD